MVKERTHDIEIQMAEVRTELKYIGESLDKFDKRNEEQHIKLEKQFLDAIYEINRRFDNEREESNKVYADKKTEKIVWFVMGTIATGIIGYCVSLLLR